MHIQIDYSMFVREFEAYNRADNFSHKGKRALFEYLEEMEESTGEPFELDIIALCCEFSEDPLQEVLENHSLESFEDLQDETWAVELDNGNVVYQVF